MKTTRKELAVADVLAAPRDGDALADLVARCRRAQVADVAPEATGDNIVPLHVRRPGPRRRTSGP